MTPDRPYIPLIELGKELSPSDFVPGPNPCDNLDLYIPVVRIPVHLMDTEKVKAAQRTLNKCQRIAGSYGEKTSNMNRKEYKKAADAFKAATGVDISEVFSYAREQLYEQEYL
ncbi:hypothetical protein A3A76_01515 [Candidatus Woesebacteria bacterium RIFCSPLOWO2_01_FULL_39_23]|uniref:Uncharacterized protein n=1 Tax=Candidatus Woesebacteria bacterium RIFCSPHIGHO2_01_FULL_40_22 TaxID=1802499 RepID=A0A1F7YGR6_9BACT|nr:MAG: hypothetical protein A2141_04855 [Candidatus Woesebacteria bacterium RBG_16_40_11]OGM26503.1 MAG: hypothetical protein A2628_03110 [Candidatus Woesebacteria bacterium RIFCSPHIGHO2_01_FULL_40_22]OGM37670.1 MAG: hypothetical protein A3E41_05630 [Candidatus Woesebacteria bacterium RIFCSPHIGHO2_12_FULL_38_9]OGM62956.1 MAG: hypothetical protein A3A76_01515 [Candidatus Woesebacteria bacterium RIFCSPLOWO2_01_FULL_39_23]